MADAVGGFDTSSYLKPGSGAPQQNLLTTAQQYGNLAQQKIQIDSAKLDLANKHFDALNQTLGGLASDPLLQPNAVANDPQAALSKIQNTVQDMVKFGRLTPQQAAIESSNIPTLQQAQQNPAAFQQHVTGVINRAADNQAQFQRTYGVPTTKNNNAAEITGNTMPQSGSFTPATVIPTQVGPGTTTIQQPELGPNGQPTGRTVPTAVANAALYNQVAHPNGQQPPLVQQVAPNGQQPVAAPQPNQNVPGQAPISMPRPGTGYNPAQGATQPQVPVQTQPQPAQQQRPPAAPAANPNQPLTGVAVGNPQGSDAAQTALAGNSVEASNSLARAAATVPEQKATIANLEGALNSANSGPLAPFVGKWGALVNQVSKGVTGAEPIPPETVKAYENFTKNAALLQAAQAKALGTTATAINASGHTVPQIDFSTAGNKEIIATLKGNQDAINAKNQAWQSFLKNGGSPQDFNQFEANFNQSFDPRAYQFPYMTPSERKGMLDQMPTTLPNGQPNPARASFFTALKNAKDNGWIKPDGK